MCTYLLPRELLEPTSKEKELRALCGGRWGKWEGGKVRGRRGREKGRWGEGR